MQIYEAIKAQHSLDGAVLSKTGASAIVREYVQNHVDVAIKICSLDLHFVHV